MICRDRLGRSEPYITYGGGQRSPYAGDLVTPITPVVNV